MKGDIGAMLAEAEARHQKIAADMRDWIERKVGAERQIGLYRDAMLRLEGEIAALRRLKRDDAEGGAAEAPAPDSAKPSPAPAPPTEPVN